MLSLVVLLGNFPIASTQRKRAKNQMKKNGACFACQAWQAWLSRLFIGLPISLTIVYAGWDRLTLNCMEQFWLGSVLLASNLALKCTLLICIVHRFHSESNPCLGVSTDVWFYWFSASLRVLFPWKCHWYKMACSQISTCGLGMCLSNVLNFLRKTPVRQCNSSRPVHIIVLCYLVFLVSLYL